jgi:hypothetical protein
MLSPFDGMGEVLAGVHGAPVIHRSQGGAEANYQWILREYPQDMFAGPEGAIATGTPELRVPRDQALGVAPGDEVETQDGRRFLIGAQIVSPNPARDALITFELRSLD